MALVDRTILTGMSCRKEHGVSLDAVQGQRNVDLAQEGLDEQGDVTCPCTAAIWFSTMNFV